MTAEIELKLLLDPEGEARLRARAAALSAAPPVETRLRAVYHDTEDHALARRRIALRVRKEGRRWVQTVKAGRGVVAGLSTVEEASCPAPAGRLSLGAVPDDALRAVVLDAIGDAPLAPVFETEMRRTAWRFEADDGAVELALDTGEIRAGAGAAPLIEAELELLEGAPTAIFAVARALFPEGPIRFSRRSKAERGYALAAGEPAVADPPPPVHAAPMALSPDQTTEEAARDVLSACLEQIAGNVAAAALSEAPEGPHQLRIGLRRLRTAAVVFRPALGGAALDALAEGAQRLAAAAGAVRDLDVLAEEQIAPLSLEDPGFPALLAALADSRAAARTALKARLAAPETQALLFDLGAFVAGRGWLRPSDYAQTVSLAAPVTETAVAAIDKRWKKAAKLGDRIGTLEGEARHDLRKALKKLRYAVEFFETLFPAKKVRPFLKALKSLQDDFGALQDQATAAAILQAPDAPGARDPAAQRAAGYALGFRRAEAERGWARAQADWAALADEKKFWR